MVEKMFTSHSGEVPLQSFPLSGAETSKISKKKTKPYFQSKKTGANSKLLHRKVEIYVPGNIKRHRQCAIVY